MKISYRWLHDFIDLDILGMTPREVARALDRIGLAVESLEDRKDDCLFDIEVTTNRPDCLNHLGIARELAAQFKLKVKRPDVSTPPQTENTAPFPARVTIEDTAQCPRYAARVITNVRIEGSPDWLKARLESVDQRPINNIVDITNYVLFELGHPLHAFDYDKLKGHAILVRRAKAGERLETLDGVCHPLGPEMLTICDQSRPVALAGIMGGQESEVSSQTRTLLLESAYFHPSSIRSTAKKLGMRTEASYRFERGADPEMPVKALNRISRLVQEIAGGVCVSPVVDQYPTPQPPTRLQLEPELTRRVVGVSFPKDFVVDVLSRLEFELLGWEGDALQVQVPSFRCDVSIGEDLVEEVARHWGYERIQSSYPAAPVPGSFLPTRSQERVLTQGLAGFGFFEAVNYVFSTPKREALFWSRSPAMIPLANPPTEKDTHLRTSLVPGLVDSVRRNLNRGNRNVRLFEFGKVFLPSTSGQIEDYQEVSRLGLIATGAFYEPFWNTVRDTFQLYHLKGMVKDLLEQLDQKAQFRRTEEVPFLHPEVSAEITVGDQLLGCLGELHPRLQQAYKFLQKVFVAELLLDPLYAQELAEPLYSSLGKFPSVERDLSFLIDRGVEYARIVDAIHELDISDLSNIRLVDLYQGKKLPTDRISVTIRLTFANAGCTLTQAQVNQYSDAIFSVLRKAFAAELRS